MKLNNLSLKTKFIMLFFCCVLLPIGCLNMIVYFYARKNIENDHDMNARTVSLQVGDYYSKLLTSADDILQYMYSSEDIYTFFNTEYENGADYYKAYLLFSENIRLSYTMAANNIKTLTFCAANETIVEGGCCARLSSVRNEQWYRQFISNGCERTVYNDRDSISVIYKLDYLEASPELVLKLELDKELFSAYIAKSKLNYNIYLFYKDSFVLGNGSYAASPAEAGSANGGTAYTNSFNEDWELVLVADSTFRILGMDGDPWIILVMALNLVLPIIVLFIIEKSITQRLIYFRNEIDRQELTEQKQDAKYSLQPLAGDFGKDEIGKLIYHHNSMVERIQLLMNDIIKKNKEKSALELSRKQAELNALLSQVNPHFIYNTLESICMKSLIKGETETCEMIRNISMLMREMSSWKEDSKRLCEEIDFARRYLVLQQYRFGEKLSYEITLDEDCENCIIPKMTVSTFVENACVHGICDSYSNGTVYIKAHKRLDDLVIIIKDTGNGIGEEQLEKLHRLLSEAEVELLYKTTETGVLNAYLRLKMYFGERLHFSIDSAENSGTEITILINRPDLYDGKEKTENNA